jgi:flagellar hook-associated protein 2
MSAISSTGSTPLSTSSGASTGANPPLTISGLASGIDTNAIIQQLVAVQQQQVTNLQNQQSGITAKETTIKQIEADLLDLQTQTNSLAASTNGIFDARSVTSSDQTIVTGAASSDATPGIYSFKVDSLAQAQEIASQGFTSGGSTITQGTFSFQVGSGPVTSITIGGSNNTLQGLANAINNSGGGVTASIVNDGSVFQPYRLVLTSNATGTANAVTITNNLGADSGSASQPVFGSTYIGAANAAAANTSTSVASSNSGAGNYTGATNNTYTFTVTNGGTVGTSDGITLHYTDSTGANSGTITVNSGDAGVAKTVAQGITVAFSAGTLVNGDTFTVQAYEPNVQAATNASVTVGSGNGALTVASSSNQVNNVIPGVTLNLVGANPSENVSLTVAANTSSIATTVQNFVNAYNTVVTDINTATSFDPSTNTAGDLLGNSDVSSIQSQLAAGIGTVVPGLTNLNNLTAIGVTANADGTLTLDSTTLNNVLNGQVPGASLNEVKSLFTLSGSSNNPGVQFITGSNSTVASSTPYQVVVTQAATQGSVTGQGVLTAPVTITGSNNTFTLGIDGQTAQTITIPPNTGNSQYTPQQLANIIQSQIAANATLANDNVQVSLSAGQLSITSSTYGTSSNVTIGSGTALSVLGFSTGQSGSGLNVAGHFVAGGNTEAATGSGQVLTGNTGNANTDGLTVQVSLTPAQVASNPQINLTVSRGVASTLSQTITGLTDPTTGRLQTVIQGFQDQVQTIQNTITQDSNEITQQENRLTAQFAAMEAIISQLKSESSVIATLTQNLNSTSSSSNNNSGISFPSTTSSSSSGG